MVKVAVFVSGGGTNLQAILDAQGSVIKNAEVALVISKEYEAIAREIGNKLDRGATFLQGEGSYTGESTKVVLVAIKKQQLAELKELVVELDPKAFIILQEAHQVLGDGFSRYSKHSL